MLAFAAAVVAVAVAGAEKWALTAFLAGASAGITGLVTRNVDKVITRGGDAVLARAPGDPITVRAFQLDGVRGYTGPLPPATEGRRDSADMVALHVAVIHLIVEAAGDRTAVIDTIDVRMESCAPPPHVSHVVEPPLPAPMSPRQLREFYVSLTVGLSANATESALSPRPAHGVPDFPYTVTPLDPDHFYIRVTTDEPGDFRWRIGVHWICKGTSGVVVADLRGQPFRLVRPEPRSRS